MNALRLIARDLRLAWAGGGLWLPVLFFLAVAILYPFAVGPDLKLLRATGGAMLWIAALLAALLPIDRLIRPDLESGHLDQLAVRGWADEAVAALKIAAHWLSFGPPLLLAALFGAALFDLGGRTLGILLGGLAVATPALAALSVTIAALTARAGGGAAGLILLPLAIPVLIFGAGSLDPGARGGLPLLAAVSLGLTVLAPFAAGAALRALRE
ncbi:heme exporter protein CcmB [Novosphingopyxis sp.]|uniref:heme exporter protein CcmB n=1 Tax=Novosphingopyxis sp. TaxID=2709690 RepID=UPI003B5A3122